MITWANNMRELWEWISDFCRASFSNPYIASPTSQLILQPFFCCSYVISSSLNSPGEPPMVERFALSWKVCESFSSFSNLSVTSPTSQHILQPLLRFTYVTAHSQTFPSLHLRHNSFSKPSVASPTSQFILQPFSRFSYVTSSSLNSPGEPPMVEWFALSWGVWILHFIKAVVEWSAMSWKLCKFYLLLRDTGTEFCLNFKLPY